MQVIADFPPNYDKIKAAFNPGLHAVFCYGERIYFPCGRELPEALKVHEQVHSVQQRGDIDGWWDRYIEDIDFRLDQEIPAHCAEYQFISEKGNRSQKRRGIKIVAGRLSSPLYNRMIKFNAAKEIILKSTQIRDHLVSKSNCDNNDI